MSIAMHMIANRDGGFQTAHFTAPVVIFKKGADRYYAGNMLADKLSRFSEAKKLTDDHIQQLRDMGYQVDVE